MNDQEFAFLYPEAYERIQVGTIPRTDILSDTQKWFQLAYPNPTVKNRKVQIGCHLEEVAEMLDSFADGERSQAAEQIRRFGEDFKKDVTWNAGVNKLELLDSLADQIVTAVGVAHMFGFDIMGALTEVNRSNYTKFVNGVPQFDENGKISKPSTYEEPNLESYI